MKTITTILLVAALTTGCMSHGTRFDMADVEAMQPGVTTYEEAVAKLGKPNLQNFAEDGSKVVAWIYATTIGAKGAKIAFDKDGKMVRIMSKVE